MNDVKADVVIVGGGVIGLSIAFELLSRGASVVVVERGQLGREASWAGAGILPPGNGRTAIHPLEKLEDFSSLLHREWHRRLLELTGIDNGFQVCGSVHLARTLGDKATLAGAVEHWRQHEIEFLELTEEHRKEALAARGISFELPPNVKAVLLPDECQIHNPNHLDALAVACRQLGGRFMTESDPQLKPISKDQIELWVSGNPIPAESVCIAAGPWSFGLLEPLRISLPTLPVRGQMVLFKLEEAPFHAIVYEGSRYLVPRTDGHVLVGATIEEVGFDQTTTDEAVDGLKSFAHRWVPELNESSYKKCWAGLRPGSFDGFPYLGRVSERSNVIVATGHFKAGLHLSTGTAAVIADLVEKKRPSIELTPFSPTRVSR